jgi:hypothetical protein
MTFLDRIDPGVNRTNSYQSEFTLDDYEDTESIESTKNEEEAKEKKIKEYTNRS